MSLEPNEIQERLDKVVLRDRKGGFPVRSIWMGRVGWPCERRLFYELTAWDKREPISVEGLYRMREGRRHEERAKSDLEDADYHWERAQQHLFIHELNLSGKVEGWVHDLKSDEKVMAEIKSVEGAFFNRLMQATDFDSSAFYQTYLPQCTCYMRAANERKILLIVRNRGSGKMKFFPYDYEPERWAKIEARCRRVNNAVEKNVPPSRIDGLGRMDVCKFCDFKTHCLPDFKPGEGMALLEDEEILTGIETYLELKDKIDVQFKKDKKRLDSLWATLKQRFEGVENAVIGNFLVTGKATTTGRWSMKIQRLDVLQNGED